MSKINLKLKHDKQGTISYGSPEYPSLYLNDVELPIGKDDVGKTLKAAVTLKLTGYGEDNSTKKDTVRFDFAIQDIEFEGIKSTERAISNAKTNLDKVFKK